MALKQGNENEKLVYSRMCGKIKSSLHQNKYAKFQLAPAFNTKNSIHEKTTLKIH